MSVATYYQGLHTVFTFAMLTASPDSPAFHAFYDTKTCELRRWKRS